MVISTALHNRISYYKNQTVEARETLFNMDIRVLFSYGVVDLGYQKDINRYHKHTV